MEQVKTENELKKEYLWGYQDHVRRINRIESELAELRAMRTSMSVNYDSMPHGSGQADLSGCIAEIDEMERELVSERIERYAAYTDIAKRVKNLRSENEMDVLFYRYIAGMDWWEVAEKMKYSERQVHRFHGKALAHFKMPKEMKDVSECQ